MEVVRPWEEEEDEERIEAVALLRRQRPITDKISISVLSSDIDDVSVLEEQKEHKKDVVTKKSNAAVTEILGDEALKARAPPECGFMELNKVADDSQSSLVIISTINDIPSNERRETPKWRIGGQRYEILKSMVFGGATESIASLSVITSAISVNISNGNMVVLGLTNIIAGLFVIRHNLVGLKKNKLKKGPNGIVVEQMKQYKETLGDALHYLLHFTMAMLSFLLFGLVPPLVYALSFRETNNKDLKLRAAAGASLSCITLLAIARAHIQKPENWLMYGKTILDYASIGVGVLALSYLAGDIFGNLIEKHGWFE